MKDGLKNHKRVFSNPPKLLNYILLIVAFTLTACGSQDETTTDSSQQSDNVSFQIPDSIRARLDTGVGTLRATISHNGITKKMEISPDGLTASVTLSNVPTGDTSFTILFTFELVPYGPLDVASSSQSINVRGGTSSINWSSAYDTASFDEDGDGTSNILELDEFSTRSPVSCTLGNYARLGSCELGS